MSPSLLYLHFAEATHREREHVARRPQTPVRSRRVRATPQDVRPQEADR